MIQTQAEMKMETLYERLSAIGLPEKFIREQALPDWWDEEFEDTPVAVVEAAAYISRRLNLDINSLLEPQGAPIFKRSCVARFKTKQGVVVNELLITHCIAARIAEMAAYACTTEFNLVSDSASILRNQILLDREFVDLEGLLNFSWSCGIPVIHFDRYPKSQDKFDGMVASFDHRPVIIISLNRCSRAWLGFILAHELGHIIKGHVTNTILIDEKVLLENPDVEEVEANQFAVELLLGKPDIGYYFPPYLTGEEMVDYARKISVRDRVDSGAVVLNNAWNKAIRVATSKEERIIWATANKSLKIIEGDADAPSFINIYAQQYLDLDKLDVDSQDYLELAIME
jgi:Zn-dependent peptidase ImmA (M78 family)